MTDPPQMAPIIWLRADEVGDFCPTVPTTVTFVRADVDDRRGGTA